jgi:hypothetical protein
MLLFIFVVDLPLLPILITDRWNWIEAWAPSATGHLANWIQDYRTRIPESQVYRKNTSPLIDSKRSIT